MLWKCRETYTVNHDIVGPICYICNAYAELTRSTLQTVRVHATWISKSYHIVQLDCPACVCPCYPDGSDQL